ncbi:hypothetical protein VIGAN_11030100, partial [Vigna angularis var. angularis]
MSRPHTMGSHSLRFEEMQICFTHGGAATSSTWSRSSKKRSKRPSITIQQLSRPPATQLFTFQAKKVEVSRSIFVSAAAHPVEEKKHEHPAAATSSLHTASSLKSPLKEKRCHGPADPALHVQEHTALREEYHNERLTSRGRNTLHVHEGGGTRSIVSLRRRSTLEDVLSWWHENGITSKGSTW